MKEIFGNGLGIDVRKIMNEVEPVFITKKKPDKIQAAARLACTDKHFGAWFYEINETYTADMPADLVALYEKAADSMFAAMAAEKKIITEE